MKDIEKNDLAEKKARKLKAMDAEWIKKRKQYAIGTSGEDNEIYPTLKSIAIFLVIGILACVLFFVTVIMNGWSGWLTLLPMALIAWMTYSFYGKMKMFEKERMNYLMRKAAVEYEEIDNLDNTLNSKRQ